MLILTGDATQSPGSFPHKGVIESLWDLYGDSITEERARNICERLKAKGFASTNVVFGIGSFTYQYVTRDTNGFAVKATWAQVDGHERLLFKNPVTDNGEKKSARGRLVIRRGEGGGLQMIDGLTQLQQQELESEDLLQPVWRDGRFLKRHTLAEIRARVRG